MANQNKFDFKENLPLMAVLLAGAFITILNQTLLATALPPIMRDFGTTESTVQWLLSIFVLVNGIMIPITAFIIKKLTTRRLLLRAMATFDLGTLISAFASNCSTLMVERILQGSGAGIMMPLLQTIIYSIYPVHQRCKAMGMFRLAI